MIYAPFRKPIHSSERPDQYVPGFGYAAYILIVNMIASRCVIWHRISPKYGIADFWRRTEVVVDATPAINCTKTTPYVGGVIRRDGHVGQGRRRIIDVVYSPSTNFCAIIVQQGVDDVGRGTLVCDTPTVLVSAIVTNDDMGNVGGNRIGIIHAAPALSGRIIADSGAEQMNTGGRVVIYACSELRGRIVFNDYTVNGQRCIRYEYPTAGAS